MLPSSFMAERLAEERMKSALREAEQARLTRAVKGPREERDRHLPVYFILGCQVDTSKGRWEAIVGREKYNLWRDALIKVGWAEWINADEPRRGWRLTRTTSQILGMAC